MENAAPPLFSWNMVLGNFANYYVPMVTNSNWTGLSFFAMHVKDVLSSAYTVNEKDPEMPSKANVFGGFFISGEWLRGKFPEIAG